jgi:hypothetical protein
MLAVMGGLVCLLVLAIYAALILGKRTDQRIRRYMSEDSDDSPMAVSFPEDVLSAKTSLTRG